MLAHIIDQQQGRLFLWVPIAFAVGIGIYFGLPVEPSRRLLAGCGLVGLAALILSFRCVPVARFAVAGTALILLGMVCAGLRTSQLAAPMLDFRYYGPVEGRLVAMDRSISDKTRLTLDQVVLNRVGPEKTPHKVRVSLHGDRSHDTELVAGKVIMLTAHLSGPRGPVEPGGFDFRRHAYFMQIGAVGYTRTPVMAVAMPERSAWIALQQIRYALSDHVREILPGQRGAFAAAVLTGDRSALSRETIDAMRATNLAHLLAISGLHMGLLTAVVFGMLRGGLALIPPLALRINSKKWAAVGALIAASAYLALSGGNVSTQRAFVMVAVMLCAVLLDRRAISLRAVALAACLILVFRPEALLGPGFQMSFAATTCLVWVFERMRSQPARDIQDALTSRARRWSRPALALLISSAVAGIATAPIGMAHFNMSATYGLPANLISVPVMGSFVMPAAVLAALLSLVGLDAWGLWLMGQGIGAILLVADTIAAWPMAVRSIPAPPSYVLPLIALTALWLMLWVGWLRYAGLAGLALALGLWVATPRPHILIAESGRLVGVMTADGRALNAKRGDGFAARAWLENDGDPTVREDAYHRWEATARSLRLQLGDITVIQPPKQKWPDCAGPTALCTLFAEDALAQSGAVAITLTAEGTYRVATVRDAVGLRPWTPPDWFRDGKTARHMLAWRQ